MINYISYVAVPISILVILSYGLINKINIFDTFLKGAEKGTKIVFNIFPTLIGLFLAIELLNASGILGFITNLVAPILSFCKIPGEIVPVSIIRPISGSGAMAISTNLLKQYGVDTKVGLIISTIMGSTETVFYTIAVYTGAINIKKSRFTLGVALISNFVAIITATIIWQIAS